VDALQPRQQKALTVSKRPMQEPLPEAVSVTLRGLNYLRDQLKPVSLRALEPAEMSVPAGLAASLVGPVSHPTGATSGSLARRLFRVQTEDAR
jgi:hypothetical protein